MDAFHLQVTDVTQVDKSLSGTTIDNTSVGSVIYCSAVQNSAKVA